MIKDLFSIIVLHYYQSEFIETALFSVFKQNYSSIELIIADDNSDDFNAEKIDEFVKLNKTDQIVKYSIIKNTKNLGTVKNVNNAVRSASGEFVIFFAADDALHDENTISNFHKSLTDLPKDQGIIAAQCLMYDDKLKNVKGEFVNVNIAKTLNESNSQEQFEYLMPACRYAIGASAFKKETIEKLGYFDEKYIIIEDWSFYLKATRQGQKIIFINFKALKHRDGGVSHYNGNDIPQHLIVYKKDLLNIQALEILPYVGHLNTSRKLRILSKYFTECHEINSQFGVKGKSNRSKIVFNNLFVIAILIGLKIVNGKMSNHLKRAVNFFSLLLLLIILINLTPYLLVMSNLFLPAFLLNAIATLNLFFTYLIFISASAFLGLISLIILYKAYKTYRTYLY